LRQARICEPVGAVIQACAMVADSGRGRALAAAHLSELRWVASPGPPNASRRAF
jgi:hypothetical protein